MFAFNIKIANKCVRVISHYYGIVSICQDFITEEDPDFTVSTSIEDFDKDAKAVEHEVRREELSNVYLEITTVLRKVSDKMIDYGILMMHGAVVAVNDEAFLFTGVSGIGKTTHILKWIDNCPGAIVLNGDKPFIITYEDERSPVACGSPWAGKEHMYTNTIVPLKAIVMIERSDINHMEQVEFKDAFFTLLQQTYRPEDEIKMRETLKLMQRLKNTVSFWRFQCNNFKEDSFQVTYEALTGKAIRMVNP